MIDASFAQNTFDTYRTGLQCFENFRTEHRLPLLWPPPVSHVTMFIAFLSLNNKSPKTAACYIAAINFRCKFYKNVDISQNFIVKKMLEGMKRSKHSKDARLPITLEILNKILNRLPVVCTSPYEALLFSAAFSMAYHGFFRVGEIVFTKLGQEHKILGVSDVKIRTINNSRVINVYIAFSKTDQEGKGTLICIQGNNTAACPVLLLQRYLLQRPNVNGALFCHTNGKPVTRYQFSAVLRKALVSAGMQSDNFKSHSFRIGAASEASANGISDSKIMELGRWKSQAVKKYLRL